ncbi:hypothetical protein THAOC_01659 [Thalassiosira oceanica]|uniref:Uncharacterized protein n=1 Tax=Thalassiosira oceanica TaxID=159749 RepID=K0TGM8_THAOC|nr:hypothetical protein THAOC_01659 [Thalassiosira oceanica]|eukprot:EJK76570.1 hypothetical protein THAOC_01659 [Thalassiosira oceanica]
MLENLFGPLFDATLRPEEHPEVAELLTHIVGFDSVDDEGAPEAPLTSAEPASWTSEENPAYSWQLYHIWANLEVLNRVRESRGLNTFAFRPHAGETGETMHLAATYMLCRSINHGINLDRQVSLQYLYYLDQRKPNPSLSQGRTVRQPALEQLPVQEDAPEPLPEAVQARPERDPVDRRPAPVPHERRRAPRGVLGRQGVVRPKHDRHIRDRAELGVPVRLRGPPEGEVARRELQEGSDALRRDQDARAPDPVQVQGGAPGAGAPARRYARRREGRDSAPGDDGPVRRGAERTATHTIRQHG